MYMYIKRYKLYASTFQFIQESLSCAFTLFVFLDCFTLGRYDDLQSENSYGDLCFVFISYQSLHYQINAVKRTVKFEKKMLFSLCYILKGCDSNLEVNMFYHNEKILSVKLMVIVIIVFFKALSQIILFNSRQLFHLQRLLKFEYFTSTLESQPVRYDDTVERYTGFFSESEIYFVINSKAQNRIRK